MTLPLSVNLMPKGPVTEVTDLAVLAERLGYRRCWVYDEGLVTRDVYVTLTAIALATEQILLGPGITNPYVRHPGVTAAAVATIDELSGGRAFVGLGAGGGLTLDPLGIDRRRPVVTVGHMVSTLHNLFAGETVDFDGEVFSLKSASLNFGRSNIAVILAGRGPRMVALGGEIADGFNLSYIHKDLLGEHVSTLRSAARRHNRQFLITYSTMLVTSEEEFREARASLSFRLADSPIAVQELIGMTETEANEIREALAEGGTAAAAHLVREEWVTQFTIVGSHKETGAELRDLLARQGIDEFQLPVQRLEGSAALIERTAGMVASS
ncbi:MAG: LLM class flavin-dependent oxidoreductase [Acidimicrobiales bacterium]|mgnify:CR=1 FL=1|jgi:5,10-methylenetetrahydromethanopterin reductase|nr:LLM class flavin-dependent oxidoreductase [Acidimicrobiales bacterium]MDP7258275.1 LLM class flavin-dependent oxidoreductase [Acidimicrobiales bacterium]HJO80744.1 LLM class flavin-dependent oxidoreductase [Acidimicrobiales bacterium]|tara:strand:- start:224 stop:1198 length:975 start_codon:yes stop_codon:yes gene_type:complete